MKKIFIFFVCFFVIAVNAQTQPRQRVSRSATNSRTDSQNQSSRIRTPQTRSGEDDEKNTPSPRARTARTATARTTPTSSTGEPAQRTTRSATARTTPTSSTGEPAQRTTRSATARTPSSAAPAQRATRTATARTPSSAAPAQRATRTATARTPSSTAPAQRATRTATARTPSSTASAQRTARTATSRTSSSTASAQRTARSATTNRAPTSSQSTARSSRSTTVRAPQSTQRTARSATTNRVPTSSQSTARAGTVRTSAPSGVVSNTQRSGAGEETVYDNVNSTPSISSNPVDTADLYEETVKPKTAAEVAATLGNEKTCLKEYTSCMDQYCKDTSGDGVTGRCLCSASIVQLKTKETTLKKYIAGINLVNTQTKQIEDAKKQSALTGKDFMEVLKDLSSKANSNEYLDSASQLITSISDLNEVYTGSVNNSTIRKEGDALLKESNKSCASYLELCPGSEDKVMQSYSIQSGNDCRVYSKSLDDKVFTEKLQWEKALSNFQSKALKTDLTTTNSLNSQQCSAELDTCMRQKYACGTNLELCYNENTTELKKSMCRDVLSKCQGVNMPYVSDESKRTENQTDVLWKAFKKSIFQKTQLSDQQCEEKLSVCVKEKCGEDGSKCLPTDGKLRTKSETFEEFNKKAEQLCSDTVLKCAAGYGS